MPMVHAYNCTRQETTHSLFPDVRADANIANTSSEESDQEELVIRVDPPSLKDAGLNRDLNLGDQVDGENEADISGSTPVVPVDDQVIYNLINPCVLLILWGWLGFNCGSTFGISGIKWILAARSAVSSITASIAGGIMGFLLSYIVNNRRFDIGYMINGVLGSLVGITALCAMAQPWESIIIGAIGSLIVNGSIELLNKLKIDDPVGCVGTHAVGGMWSLLSAGLFSRRDTLADALQHQSIQDGLFHGGGFNQLGIQALAVLAITVWTVVLAVIFLKVIDFVLGIRMPLVEELIGADIVEHGIGEIIYDKKHRKLLNLGQYQRQSVDAVPNESREQVRTVMSQHGRRGSGLLGHCHVLSDAEVGAFDELLSQNQPDTVEGKKTVNGLLERLKRFRFSKTMCPSSDTISTVETVNYIQECQEEEPSHHTHIRTQLLRHGKCDNQHSNAQHEDSQTERRNTDIDKQHMQLQKKATVTDREQTKTETYVGIASDSKERYRNHKTSFNTLSRRNETELSKCI
ncbi:hypothetical protein ScPMuIL_014425 [Solemya velum]